MSWLYIWNCFKSKEETEKQWEEIKKIATNISQSRGNELRDVKSFSYESVTNDEFSKFGNGNEFFKKNDRTRQNTKKIDRFLKL